MREADAAAVNSGEAYFDTPAGPQLFMPSRHRIEHGDDGSIRVHEKQTQAPRDPNKPERGLIFPGGYNERGEFSRWVLPEIIHAPTVAFERLTNDPRAIRSDNPQVRDQAIGDILSMGSVAVSPGVAGSFAGTPVRGSTGEAIRAFDAGMPHPAPVNPGPGTITGSSIARQRADATLADIQAHADHNVRTFGPSFNQGPVASVGKQITETPLLGAPLRNNLDETMQDAASAVGRLATEISPNATPETAGRGVQRGLERYGHDNVRQIDPDRLTAIGVQPIAPVNPRSMMTQDAAARLTQADQLRTQDRLAIYNAEIARGATPEAAARAAQAQVPALAPGRGQMAAARRGVDDMSDDELRRIIVTPSVDTSFRVKQEALYEQAWRQLPAQFRTDGSRNPQMLAPVNLRTELGTLEGQIANQISGQSTIRGPLADRIQGRGVRPDGTERRRPGQFTLPQLRDIRTEIGRAMDDYNPTHQSLNQSQLRGLYAAVSRDIEVGVQDLANRALINSRLPTADPAYVPAQVANQAARALRYFQRADNYTRTGIERMERFAAIVGTDNPQNAARRLITAATDRTTGNMQLVRAAMGSVRPEDRAEFASMLIQELGRPVNSARGIIQEVGWSPNSFVTRYTNMSPEARALVFDPAHRQSLESLFRVANRLANVEALANTSRTATNAINLGGATTAVGSIATGNIALPLAIGGSMLAASVLMSRPAYANWMAGYIRLRAAVRDGSDTAAAALVRHAMRLDKMAIENPALLSVLASVEADMASKSSDRSARESRLLSQARDAIRRNAKRHEIEAELRRRGIDPAKLGPVTPRADGGRIEQDKHHGR